MTPNPRRVRAGFTLVELGVVIAIIALLAGLAIAFLPSLSSQTDEANGAANLQGWLNIARQKAIRNQNPYGLRLWVKDTSLYAPALPYPNMMVTECQYIEQPDDFTGGSIITMSQNGAWDTIVMAGVDPTGGFADPTLYPVQPGDSIEVLGSGLMHRITSVNTVALSPIIPAPSLSLFTPIPYQIPLGAPTPNYRILRAPRVVGAETLPLPSGVVVDLTTNAAFGNTQPPLTWIPAPPPNATGAYVDIVFGPSGALLKLNTAQTFTALWVRQPDLKNISNVFAGAPTIIAIFGQTGLVGAYPPSASTASPYVDIH